MIAVVDELWSKVPLARHFGLSEPQALASARVNFLTNVAPRYLDRLNAQAGSSTVPGHHFILGATLSLADAWIFALYTQIASGAYSTEGGVGLLIDINASMFKSYPSILTLLAAFREHELFLKHGEPM